MEATRGRGETQLEASARDRGGFVDSRISASICVKAKIVDEYILDDCSLTKVAL